MPIIKNTSERNERAGAKRRAALRFFRDEIYSVPATIGTLWGVQERGTRATLSSMEKDGLIKRHSLLIAPGMPPMTVIGITQHGQSMAFDIAAGEVPSKRSFEPGRYSLVQLAHRLDIQHLRIKAEATKRVAKWTPGHALDIPVAKSKKIKRPDAEVKDFSGKVSAVEVERYLKSVQRYKSILENYLTAIKQGKYKKVIWACPVQKASDSKNRIASAERLEAIMKSIKSCNIAGISTVLAKEHWKYFVFCDYQSFTDHIS